MKLYINLKSDNTKTGPIPVSTSSKKTCPSTCPFINSGCYARSGQLNFHWLKVGEDRNISHAEFFATIQSLPDNQLWRHNQAGDLIHNDGLIDVKHLHHLTEANKGKRGFTYTHHLLNKHNLKAIKKANKEGFTINASANNVSEAIEYAKKDIPVVCVIPSTDKRKKFQSEGKTFVTCPATYKEGYTCKDCGMCQNANRKSIIAFPAHGTGKLKVNKIIAE